MSTSTARASATVWASSSSGAHTDVLVGLDGSSQSKRALESAVSAASVLHGRLVAVTAFDYPPTFGRMPLSVGDIFSATKTDQAAMLADLPARAPDIEIDAIVEEGPPIRALLRHAAEAALLVVGSRGHSGVTGMLLGSVSMACIVHAPCPVLVMRTLPADGPTGTQRQRRVVVGVTRGASSVAALRVARRAAAHLGAQLDVVTSWDFPGLPGESYVPVERDIRHAAEQAQREVIDEVFKVPEQRPICLVFRGSSADVLIEHSATADLLVVGRAHGGALAGTLLHATSIASAEHASCPVLVVPETTTAD